MSVPWDLSHGRFGGVSPALDPFWSPRLGLRDTGWQRSAFRGRLDPFHSYFVFPALARLLSEIRFLFRQYRGFETA